MTFEHIPPRNALNNQSAKMYSGDDLIKRMHGKKVDMKFNKLEQVDIRCVLRVIIIRDNGMHRHIT